MLVRLQLDLPSFDVVVDPKRIPAEEVNKAVDNLVTAAFGEPETLLRSISATKACDEIFGNPVEYLSEDGFEVPLMHMRFFDI